MSFELTKDIVALAKEYLPLKEDTPAEYASMKYPKLLPMMRFTVHRYRAEGFGTVTTMNTSGMAGLMKLSTFVFTPSAGASIPFLLMDTMTMGKKKSLAYVEYYDCTANGAILPDASNQPKEFAHLSDYPETPAWYVNRRTPYSLIKQRGERSQKELDDMMLTCLKRYLASAKTAPKDAANLAGLKAFRQELCDKGNPSTGTMTKVLGAEGARRFFETAIMPLPQ